jgi:hypothetical protein
MIDMEVFDKIPKPWFMDDKAPEGLPPIGEDIAFCQIAKEYGYKIFVDTSIPAGHLTTMVVNTATNRLYNACKTAQSKKAIEVDARRNY